MIRKTLIGCALFTLGYGCDGLTAKKLAPTENVSSNSEQLVPLTWDLDSSRITNKCDLANQAVKEDLAKLLTTSEPTFANTVAAMDRILAEYANKVDPLAFYGQMASDENSREAGIDCEKRTKEFLLETFTREDLYDSIKAVAEKKEVLDEAEKILLTNYLQNFKDNGLDLDKNKKNDLDKLNKDLINLETEFQEALTNEDTKLEFSKEELEGLPSDLLQSLAAGSQPGTLLLTLKYPHFIPAMKYIKNPHVREKILTAYQQRGGKENKNRLTQAIIIRSKIAKLLGYKNHAEHTLRDRMAVSSETVKNFIERIKTKVQTKNTQNLNQILEQKRRDTKDPTVTNVDPWDVSYYSRMIKENQLQIDEEKEREYFPLNRVLDGMFNIYQTILGVTYIQQKDAPTWHQDVSYYQVVDTKSQKIIGAFYLDLFPRPGKYGHAAEFSLQKAYEKADGSYSRPMAAVLANFSPATADKPALLRHSEVETLFHEFGHVMHELLTQARYASLAGTNVKWDFVEAPSQMLENWVWDKETLGLMSGHYQTKEPLPAQMLQKLLQAKYFHQGIHYIRQVFYASVDMKYHTLELDGKPFDTSKIYNRLFTELTSVPAVPDTWPEASFGHLMGGYDAGYYGYLWSEVYAQDMFTRFKKEGLLNPETGAAYRRWILEAGGEQHPQSLLTGFLQREPNEAAFLEQFKH